MSDFESMTTAELRSYAEENGIDLGDAKTKTKILSVLTGTESEISSADNQDQVVIGSETAEKPKRVPTSSMKTNDDNTITISSGDRKPAKKEVVEEVEEEKVVLFSPKNLRWNMLGTLVKGYNVVTKEAAEKWTTLKGIREASPEEVASYYGL